MSLLLNEKCLDLGRAGVLALSCEMYSAVPVLATDTQYARWHTPDGDVLDVQKLFLKPMGRERVRECLRESLAAMAGRAVASVIGSHEWALSRIDEVPDVMPVDVVSFGDGHVLALYAVRGDHASLRLIDIPAGRTVYEEHTDALADRWQLPHTQTARLLALSGDPPRLEFVGRDHVRLYLRACSALFRGTDPSWKLLRRSELGAAGCFAADNLVERDGDHQSKHFVVSDPESLQEVAHFEGKGKGWIWRLAGARDVRRIALSYQGGTVEIVDLATGTQKSLRPVPQASKNAQLPVGMSSNGRYLTAHNYREAQLVDVELGRIASIDLPRRDDFDRHHFTPAVGFLPDQLVRDDSLVTLFRGTLRTYRCEDLEWKNVVETARAKAKRRDDPLATFGLTDRKNIIAAWRKPAVALRPVAKRKGASNDSTSFLYGATDLPLSIEWPSHAGVPMVLLGQIDLAQVAEVVADSPLPRAGRLLCFCSIDATGEVVEGEDFGTPAEVRVILLNDAASPPTPDASQQALPAVPLKLKRSPYDLPDPDATIVQSQHWDDEELERYRAYVEFQRGGADNDGGGHRLGGYPCVLQNNSLEFDAASRTETDDSVSASKEASAAARWRLLLQFESDEFMWGTDSGILYLMIHEVDLAALDFSRVVALTQGY